MEIKGLNCESCLHTKVCANKEQNITFASKLEKMQDRDGSIYTNVDLDLQVDIYCPHFIEEIPLKYDLNEANFEDNTILCRTKEPQQR